MKKDLQPVFAEFGACVQVAQVLEYGLSLLIIFAAKQKGGKFEPKPISAMDSKEADQTLGELFSVARTKEYFTDAEVKMVFRAIRERNTLVHRYMVDKVEELLNPEGRARLIKDIQERRKVLETANEIVESLINRYLEEHGTNMEALKEQVESFYDEDSKDSGWSSYH
ncbi:MAG: hypothetical protein MJA83_15930 [Gammaproteobacteria bacterium]|nr:hypothetical protein [Gammaproteobacteria bacterium]